MLKTNFTFKDENYTHFIEQEENKKMTFSVTSNWCPEMKWTLCLNLEELNKLPIWKYFTSTYEILRFVKSQFTHNLYCISYEGDNMVLTGLLDSRIKAWELNLMQITDINYCEVPSVNSLQNDIFGKFEKLESRLKKLEAVFNFLNNENSELNFKQNNNNFDSKKNVWKPRKKYNAKIGKNGNKTTITTAGVLFLKENREMKFKTEEYAGLFYKEKVKKLYNEWKDMSPKEKEPYYQRFGEIKKNSKENDIEIQI